MLLSKRSQLLVTEDSLFTVRQGQALLSHRASVTIRDSSFQVSAVSTTRKRQTITVRTEALIVLVAVQCFHVF